MEKILERLLAGEDLSATEMELLASESPEALEAQLEASGASEQLWGWCKSREGALSTQAVGGDLHAVIDIKLDPEWIPHHRLISEKIAREHPVESCYQWTGDHDILVFVREQTVSGVARWIAERLKRIPGILGSETHFILKTFENQGYQRLVAETPVSPR